MNQMSPQIFISLMVLLSSVIAVWMRIERIQERHDVRLTNVEKNDDRIMAKLDDIGDDIQDIKVELKDKQNRNN